MARPVHRIRWLTVCHALGLTAAAALAPPPASEAADWPRWLGPRGDATAVAPGAVPDGGEVRLRELWRRPIGEGYSSISVAGGRAYTLESTGGEDQALALDAGDGRELWRVAIDRAGDGPHTGPMSTPAIDGGRVFVLNERGRLRALAAEDGAPLWSHDLIAEYGASPPSYGISTSPLVAGELVIVLVGGEKAHNLAAFEKSTGEVAWTIFPARYGSYSSPVLGELGGRRQIVVPAGDRLYGIEPASGDQLWTHAGLKFPDRNPLLMGDRLFMALETEAVMLRVAGDGREMRLEESWRSDELRHSYSPAVHHDGSLYSFGGPYLTCLDAASGEVRWRENLGGGMLILVDGHLLVLGQMNGRLQLVAADPAAYREKAAVRALPAAASYTPPSFSGGRIFVRNEEEIAAFELAAGDSAGVRQPGTDRSPASPAGSAGARPRRPDAAADAARRPPGRPRRPPP